MNAEGHNREPIAITGIGCRFPGGIGDPRTFWDVLRSGRNVISEVPADRWSLDSFYHRDPEKPGRIMTRFGGFLETIDEFDAAFFGFSPREAAFLDPQQRLLLETVWEAFEDSGHPPENMAGTRTCVFIGEFALDYKLLLLSPQQRNLIGIHTCTGSFATVLANRISHWFDLRGPSITLDTACSSSLIAVHLACQSVWSGESDFAIAGGVNAIFMPEWTIAVSKGGFLSPDGQCKAFAAGANGYVRSEGAGVVLLKPLSSALARGDRIYALIRGTASNQDGRTPGITVPSETAQAALLREAYARAAVDPASVYYVEAHGTGTAVGDPAEAGALGAVLSEGRSQNRPCLIGSVKTNLGHLEAAAGVAGLIKSALCLHHKAVPPHPLFDAPNPNIDFDRLCLRVPTRLEDWPGENGRRFAGVNSFGFGGANAHVVLQDVADRDHSASVALHTPVPRSRPCLLAVSARSEQALKSMAERYAAFLETEPESAVLNDIAYSAGARRGHHPYRLAIVAESSADARQCLTAYRSGKSRTGMIAGHAGSAERRRLVFVYSGMGPQWAGMGRGLMADEPVFRKMMERCDAMIRKLAGWSLIDELSADEGSRVQETFIAQPAIFAFQAALTELWRSWGIVPDAIVGHSVGEAAAQYAAGALCIEDALTVIYHRSRLQHRTAGTGTMLAVGMPPGDTESLLACFDGRVSIAAINSPSDVTLSGDRDDLAGIERELAGRGVFARFLNVGVPYHSRTMETIRDELLASLAEIRPRSANLVLVSTVTGAMAQGSELNAAYWWRNVRNPVRFADAVKTLLDRNYTLFLEISPHPVLSHAVTQCVADAGVKGDIVTAVRRREPELTAMLAAAGRLYALGFMPDWERLCPGGRFVRLPSYAWQRERHWLESEESARDRLGRMAHPLLGRQLQTASHVWQRDITSPSLQYMFDHHVQASAVFPGAAYAEMAFAAAREALGGDGPIRLDSLTFQNPLFLNEHAALLLQLNLAADRESFEIHSSVSGTGDSWRKHAAGSLTIRPVEETRQADMSALRRDCVTAVSVDDCYRAFAETGLEYGPAFRRIASISVGHNRALAEFHGSSGPDGYLVHPALLDNGLQTLLAAFLLSPGHTVERTLYLPVRISRIVLYDRNAAVRGCHAEIDVRDPHAFTGRISLLGESGRIVLEACGIRCQALSPSDDNAQQDPARTLYKNTWRRCHDVTLLTSPGTTVKPGAGRWLVFADRNGFGAAVASRLASQGHAVVMAYPHGTPPRGPMDIRVNPDDPEDMARAVRSALSVGTLDGILHLGGLDSILMERGDGADLRAACVPGCLSVLYLIRALTTLAPQPPPRLWLVTRGAQHVPDSPSPLSPLQAAIWGLGRVIANEHPDYDCSLVDLDAADPEDKAGPVDALVRAALSPTDEREIAWRGNTVYVHRFETLRPRDLRVRSRAIEPGQFPENPFRLETTEGALLDGLAFRACDRREPARGEVEIQVRAAGLNFKDVAKTMGWLSEESLAGTYSGRALGLECSGVVVRAGEGVADFNPGDAVVCFPRHGFAPYAIADARLACRKPEHLSFEDAAGVPLVFVTAYYGLHHLARLSKGERLLIHSAAGGVGLAAIQLARLAGAEIFATAGSAEKRAYLETLGIRHVMDSRTPAFADRILEATHGEGVDVVLNSLAGDSLAAGLSILSPGGRFIELGKRDIEQNRRIGLAQFQNNQAFFAVDIDKLAADHPSFVGAILTEVMKLFADGSLTPAPTRGVPLPKARDYFEIMAQARHTGKIVFRVGPEKIPVLSEPLQGSLIDAQTTCLITGGLKGFGLEAARWLVSRGARHIALAGRSGALAPDAETGVQELRRNASVRIVKSDVGDRNDLSRALSELRISMPPISGIIHCANVYEDAPIADMTADMFMRVMAPKVEGAWNLHVLSAHLHLDFFILFSSISSVVGNPGQAGYCAANAVLDAVAHWRRSRQLPCLSVNWGPIATAGYVARNKSVEDHLRRIGYDMLTPGLAFEQLEALLRAEFENAAVARIRWNDWLRHHPVGASPRFSSLVESPVRSKASPSAETPEQPFRIRLEQAAADERRSLIAGHIRLHVAEVLGWDPEKPMDPDCGFFDMGMDSMLSMELRNRLQRSFNRSLPSTLVFKYPTVNALADFFALELFADGPSPVQQEPEPPRDATLDKLSDDELAGLLKRSINGMMEKHP